MDRGSIFEQRNRLMAALVKNKWASGCDEEKGHLWYTKGRFCLMMESENWQLFYDEGEGEDLLKIKRGSFGLRQSECIKRAMAKFLKGKERRLVRI